MKDKDIENVDLEKAEETEEKTENVGEEAGEKAGKSDRMRRLRMGGYSILLVMFVVAAAIIVNLIVGAIPKEYTQFELTGFGLYEVSDTAKELLAGLDRDITVSCMTTEEGCDPQIAAFLDRYTSYTDRIKVVYVDPNSNPDFVNSHNVESMNSLVVQSWEQDPETGDRTEFRSRTIDYYDIYEFSQDVQNEYYSNYNYMIYGVAMEDVFQRDVFDADNELSSAIDYVTTDNLPVAYMLTGHGEIDLSEVFTSFIDSNNIALGELGLLASDIPDDAGVILINNPSLDLTEDELSKLTAYIDNGGKILLVTDVTSYSTEKLPNLTQLAKHCGLDAVDGVILESDSNRYNNNRFNVISTLESMDITKAIYTNPSGVLAYLPRSHAIVADEEYDGAMTVEPIIKTSADAYVIGASEEERDRADDDPTGEFYLGAISRDGSTGSAFVWFSSSFINDEGSYAYVRDANLNVYASSITTICEKPKIVSVAGTMTDANATLLMSNTASTALTAVIQYAIPAAVLLLGVVIFLIRKFR